MSQMQTLEEGRQGWNGRGLWSRQYWNCVLGHWLAAKGKEREENQFLFRESPPFLLILFLQFPWEKERRERERRFLGGQKGKRMAGGEQMRGSSLPLSRIIKACTLSLLREEKTFLRYMRPNNSSSSTCCDAAAAFASMKKFYVSSVSVASQPSQAERGKRGHNNSPTMCV